MATHYLGAPFESRLLSNNVKGEMLERRFPFQVSFIVMLAWCRFLNFVQLLNLTHSMAATWFLRTHYSCHSQQPPRTKHNASRTPTPNLDHRAQVGKKLRHAAVIASEGLSGSMRFFTLPVPYRRLAIIAVNNVRARPISALYYCSVRLNDAT